MRYLFLDINEIATGRRIYQGLISRTKKKAPAPVQAAPAARTGRRKNGSNKNEVYLTRPAKIKDIYGVDFMIRPGLVVSKAGPFLIPVM